MSQKQHPEDSPLFLVRLWREDGSGEHSARRGKVLHVVSGEVLLHDLVLTRGDGAGISAERSASFTALAEAEVLLVDVT